MMDLDYLDNEQTARCKRLAIHVLQELILSLAELSENHQSGERAKREREQLKREALRFVLAESPEPFGFAWLAETLEIDSMWLKQTLLSDIQFFITQWNRAGDKNDVWVTNMRAA